jgi:hypothetical protein
MASSGARARGGSAGESEDCCRSGESASPIVPPSPASRVPLRTRRRSDSRSVRGFTLPIFRTIFERSSGEEPMRPLAWSRSSVEPEEKSLRELHPRRKIVPLICNNQFPVRSNKPYLFRFRCGAATPRRKSQFNLRRSSIRATCAVFLPGLPPTSLSHGPCSVGGST